MPAIQPPAKVLVTGASGFIASATVKSLVEHGFDVVGTVRSASKGEYHVKQFGEKFTYAIVQNMEEPTAFDEVIKTGNFDGIVHMASPVLPFAEDPQDQIRPAVQGTTAILNSALKFGPTVKRIVITASVASITEPKDEPYTFSEKDWNTKSVKMVEELGKGAEGLHKYRASKTLAEKAAWAFIEENKASIKFDLVTIHPTFAFGPMYNDVTSPTQLNATSGLLLSSLTSTPAEPGHGFIEDFIDVRDAAEAHYLGLIKEEAGNERLLVSAGHFTMEGTFRPAALKAKIPAIAPARDPSGAPFPENTQLLDVSKADRILGIKYHTLEEMLVDSFASYREKLPQVFGLPAKSA